MRSDLEALYQKVYSGEMSAEEATVIADQMLRDGDVATPGSASQLAVFTPEWTEVGISDEGSVAAGESEHRLIVVSSSPKKDLHVQTVSSVEWIQVDTENSLTDEYIQLIWEVVQVCQRWINESKGNSLRISMVVLDEGAQFFLEGLTSVMRTLSREVPSIDAGSVYIKGKYTFSEIESLLEKELSTSAREVRYDGGVRLVREYSRQYPWQGAADDGDVYQYAWPSDVEYIIVGGAGGIGQNLISHIRKFTPNAVFHILGRSSVPNSTITGHKDNRYYSVDVTNSSSLDRVLRDEIVSLGTRYSIIFSAGVIDDDLIENATEEKISKVLSPKVIGLENLDRLTKDLDIEQFICFSSITGVFGNKGQVDYSAANSFVDCYARYRNTLVEQGERTGRSVSIAWPLWKEGGMGNDPGFQEFIARETGIHALDTQVGMQVCDWIMGSNVIQPIVINGDLKKFEQEFLSFNGQVSASDSGFSEPSVSAGIDSQGYVPVSQYFISVFSEVTKIPLESIKNSTSFDEVGIDSIMISELNQKLESAFPDVSKTLFYEHKFVGDAISRLENDYPKGAISLVKEASDVKIEPVVQLPRRENTPKKIDNIKPESSKVVSGSVAADELEPIAIVGISGAYPGAKNLDEFWQNLVNGRDAITEIPEDRWCLEGFYESDIEKAISEGKSYSKWGGFLEGFADFDPLFFNISPKEAASIDPHERLFLQVCWSAMEEAGYSKWHFKNIFDGKVGVFAGITKNGFELYTERLANVDKTIHLRTSYSSIANRVSYVLDLNGPSVPVDTMCSSSLSAIHAACNSLRSKESRMAFAGGVNLYLHPDNYVQLCAPRMLSKDGQCKAFGANANGFVPGEGVGVVLLKPLFEAEKDKDHIHGIIRSTAINHGGKTSGYTVPNPVAQSSLVSGAIENAEITAGDISYIEAHGTGTDLGDPIEISGLTQAFSQSTDKKQYCRIGSVKSNIGHLEAAAGIASLTKVLLQMKHDTFAPTLHVDSLNPNIQFDKTPFVVSQTRDTWKEQRKVAGISSFGAGGANAHILIENYRPPLEKRNEHDGTYPFFFSAPNVSQLRKSIELFVEHIEKADTNPLDVSYTLVSGREHHKCRLAVVAEDLAGLSASLCKFLTEDHEHQAMVYGEANHQFLDESKSDYAEDKISFDGRDNRQDLMEKSKAWVSGGYIERGSVFSEFSPRRVSLPVYSFERKKIWIGDKLESTSLDTTVSKSHEENIQNSEGGLRTSFTISADDPLVLDHVLGGDPILPGAAQIQFVSKGVKSLLAQTVTGGKQVAISDVVYLAPVVVKSDLILAISYVEKSAGVYEVSIGNKEGDVRYTQAVVELVNTSSQRNVLDRETLSGAKKILSGDEIYQRFQSVGMNYGKRYQLIESIRECNNTEIAASTIATIHTGIDDRRDGVNPYLLDAVLQSTLGVEHISGVDQGGISVPFAIEKFSLFESLPSTIHALATKRPNTGSGVSKIDIAVYDNDLNIVAEIKGYSYRYLDNKPQFGLNLYGLELVEVSDQDSKNIASDLLDIDVLCFVGANQSSQNSKVSNESNDYRTVFIGNETTEYAELCAQTVAFLQVLQQERKHDFTRIRVMFSSNSQMTLGLKGVFKSLNQEASHINCDFVVIDEDSHKRNIEAARSLPFKNLATHLNNGGVWYEEGYEKLDTELSVIKQDAVNTGCWVISGGGGALGLNAAAMLLKEQCQCSVALLGRSKAPRNIDQFVQLKRDFPNRVSYYSTDISNRSELAKTLESIRGQADINGVIHAAGVLNDAYVVQQDEKSLRDVLQPKVAGVTNLDALTQNDPIQVFLCYSSLASEYGNAGQAVYSAANGFLDHFVSRRNQSVNEGMRNGRSVSINWPYWELGGMQIGDESEARLLAEFGMKPLPSALGDTVLSHAISSNIERIIAIYGNKASEKYILGNTNSLRGILNPGTLAPAKSAKTTGLSIEDVQQFLSGKLAGLLDMSPDDIDIDAPLEAYGIDSIHITNITNALEEDFGRLSKTLFFEYLTLGELSDYFYNHHKDTLSTLLASEESSSEEFVHVSTESVDNSSRFVEDDSKAPSVSNAQSNETDIAIVGVAGRYPQSDDLKEFWDNLKAGRDCVTEIPEDRWDHEQYFDPARGKDGKTYTKWGGFISEVDRFDASFFGIAPREAEIMDPQERLFLECVYHTMEDAGYTRDSLAENCSNHIQGNVGVFAGAMYEEYQLYAAQAQALGKPFIVSGNPASIANRVSHFCNFHGPSMTIDTMCSSALSAIHLACESIQAGTCDAAFAGGVNVSIHPNKYLSLGKGQFASSDGKCTSFGEGGDGYVPGEGVGAVLLKPLSKAIKDGDRIYGVIKATSVNHGGKTNGYTVPNPKAQAQVVARSIEKSNIDPRHISYIEAHGTGTSLGDPIEIAGLSQAFGKHTNDTQFCAIGSAKSNIGHCESAAGIAGLTKVLMQMQHKTLVPSIHCDVLNPNIDFESSPFVVQKTLSPWEPSLDGKLIPRIAGLSSFGAGGSNAHLIIEEYTPRANDSVESISSVKGDHDWLIPISARSEASLLANAQKLHAFLEPNEGLSISDLSYTLSCGREHFSHRVGLVASDLSELSDHLKTYLNGENSNRIFLGNVKKTQKNNVSSDASGLNEIESEALSWVSNANYKLDGIFQGIEVKRISAPLYSFDKERFWLPDDIELKLDAVASVDEQTVLEVSSAGKDLVYAESWEPISDSNHELGNITSLTGRVLVLSLDSDRSALSRDSLSTLNPDAELVYVALTNDDVSETAINKLLDEFSLSNGVFDSVLTIGALALSKSHEYIQCVVSTIKAIVDHKVKNQNGEHPYLAVLGFVNHSNDVAYARSLVGFHRSLKMAAPSLSVGMYLAENYVGDSEPQTISNAFARIAQKRHECIHVTSDKMLRPTVAEKPLGNAHSLPIERSGTYLITGGVGGIGYIFAKHLVNTYGANLILVGRTSLNDQIKQKVEALTTSKNQVQYYACDISDYESVASAEISIRSDFQTIDGIIHSAGIEPKEQLKALSWDEFAKVLSPKISGTLNLDKVFSNYQLDFLCLFSSTSAVLGDGGSGCYGMANRYMSEFAQGKGGDTNNGKVIALGWPIWEQGGMQDGRDKEMAFYLKSTGQTSLTEESGVGYFEKLLKSGLGAPYLFVGDDEKIRRFVERVDQPVTKVAKANKNLGSDLQPNTNGDVSGSGVTLSANLVAELKQMTSSVLKLSEAKIDVDENLTDFGYDSISLGELSESINSKFAIDVSPAVFFSHQTLNEIANHLVEEYPETFIEPTQVGLVETNSQGEQAPEIASEDETALSSVGHESEPQVLSPRENNANGHQPIAIIGMSGRFPDARNIDELWQILNGDKNVLSTYEGKRDEWKDWLNQNTPENIDSDSYIFGQIPGIKEFDPLFFEMSPAEAKLLDPRQRLLLQEAWRALEDAAFGPQQIKNSSMGMFVGVEQGDYQHLVGDSSNITANHDGVLAARLAYHLNLDGPTLAINTACSSGLVALHQACNSLKMGECDSAIVAAVNTLITPRSNIALKESGMLSESGNVFAFDSRADGMIPSEAVVAFVIKPLSLAIRDNDPIHAVIEGSGINYDGKTNGITAPNGKKQEQLLESVYRNLPVSPAEVDVFVTQTAGTKLGDSVEVNALVDVVNRDTTESQGRKVLYSTKPSVGHSFAASGLVSLASLVKSIKEGVIPETKNYSTPSEFVNWRKSSFTITDKSLAWDSTTEKRFGATSAFGMSGTNAHVVLSSVPNQTVEEEGVSTRPSLFVFSGKNKESLASNLKQACSFIEEKLSSSDLENYAYTLSCARQHFEHRCAVVASGKDELLERISDFIETWSEQDNVFVTEEKYVGQRSSYSKVARAYIQDNRNTKDLTAYAELYVDNHISEFDALYAGSNVRRLHAPGYEFSRIEYWPNTSHVKSQVEKPVHHTRESKAASSPTKLPSDQDSVESILAHVISEHLEIDDSESFRRSPLQVFGFNSIQSLAIKQYLLLNYGAEIPLKVFGVGDKSIHQIALDIEALDGVELSLDHTQRQGSPEAAPQTNSVFPLTDIQEAYFVGRVADKENPVGAHIYIEFSIKEKLDMRRLNRTWNALLERHPMLRMCVSECGGQTITSLDRPYTIKTVDLRRKSSDEKPKFLDQIRSQMESKVYDGGASRFYDLRLSLIDDDKSILHFSIDELICDGRSIEILMKDWESLYLDKELPELNFSFENYSIAAHPSGEAYQRDLAYWFGQHADLPMPPKFPAPSMSGDEEPHVRLKQTYNETIWKKVVSESKRLGVSETSLILSTLVNFIAKFTGQDAFSLLLTLGARLPVHKQVNSIVGPCVSTGIFKHSQSFEGFDDQVKSTHDQLIDILEHMSVSAISMLREMKKDKRLDTDFTIPVVFTSMLNNSEGNGGWKEGLFSNVIHSVNQTPQVGLDCQVRRQKNGFEMSWDINTSVYDKDTVVLMFSIYRDFVIHYFGNDPHAGDKYAMADFIVQAKARSEVLNQRYKMTDQQLSYAIGRESAYGSGQNSCQFYQQVECPTIDIDKLNAVISNLLADHEILNSVLHSDGSIEFRDQISNIEIPVHDLKNKTTSALDEFSHEIAQEMLDTATALGEWPYFSVQVSHLNDTTSWLHICIDMIVADAPSIELIIKEILSGLSQESPCSKISNDVSKYDYRSYLSRLENELSLEESKDKRAYWRHKFSDISAGPSLVKDHSKAVSEHSRIDKQISNWAAFKNACEERSYSITDVLLAAYMEVLSIFNAREDFSVVVPTWDRPDIHPNIHQVVGDFTNLAWVSHSGDAQSFSGRIEYLRQDIENDLAQWPVSGISELRRMMSRQGKVLEFPVVFTGGVPSVDLPSDSFKLGISKSQTPNVALDCLSAEVDGVMTVAWDYESTSFSTELVNAMFSAYTGLIEGLASDEALWRSTKPVSEKEEQEIINFVKTKINSAFSV